MDAVGQRALSIAQDLIRFDTTNTGDSASQGERQAAEYVIGLLQDCGYQPIYLESEPRRGNVMLRIEGHDDGKPPLVLHGHLDVVPAQSESWTVDPFGVQISDGFLWGRGAVDMKNFDAVILALIEYWAATGQRPARDLLVCFFADEEAGGRKGAHWLVDHHPDFFIGAEEAVGEVGGFSTMVAGQRTYLLQTAEKGIAWLQLVARGTAGHGSARNTDNAVFHLVEALTRVTRIAWPISWNETVRRLLTGAAELAGLSLDWDDPTSLEAVVAAFGPASRWVASSIATSCNLTGLAAGGKINVVPEQASALLDI
ncbi:MAG: M20/M25/M40 family metallo-hydrolase, partial [Micrococcales bacterium]|nr:M20/M25/M40 family metallo-hydrolase [Micrococcales bacterium]